MLLNLKNSLFYEMSSKLYWGTWAYMLHIRYGYLHLLEPWGDHNGYQVMKNDTIDLGHEQPMAISGLRK